MAWIVAAAAAVVILVLLAYLLLERGDEADGHPGRPTPRPVTDRGPAADPRGAGSGLRALRAEPAPASEELAGGATGSVEDAARADFAPSPASFSPAPAGDSSSASRYARLPSPDALDEEGDEDITLLAELPPEIRALQKGYRKTRPKQRADLTVEVKVEEELLLDEALVEELLSEEPTGPHPLISIRSAAATDRGKKRKLNEDAFLCLEGDSVFVVADGMGGHAAGERASRITVEVIKNAFERGRFDGEPHVLWPRRGDELARSLEMANQTVYELANKEQGLRGMGTTATAIRFSANRQRAYIAHAGDSRCYRLRNEELVPLTVDHTLRNLLGARGPLAGQLARAIGVEAVVEVDLRVDEPLPGDRYLLCSDGLTKMVTDEEICQLILAGEDVSAMVERLIDEANERGGKDNITVILIEVDEPFSS